MAAGIIPAPSPEAGHPCEGCDHTDCIKLRMEADRLCGICGQPIGYERRFYNVEGELVHADEYEDKIERERT